MRMMKMPLSITVSAIAIYLVSACMLIKHVSIIFNITLPFNMSSGQGSIDSSIISVVINVLLLLTVWIKVKVNSSVIYHRLLNSFIVIFFLLFLLMSLQSLQSGEWLLLTAAFINIAALALIFFYQKRASDIKNS
jgi:hypothetical protein